MSDAPASPPESQALSGTAAYAAAAEELLGATRMQLCVLSHALDARVFGTEGFVERARAFCLSHERALIRVLVNQPDRAVRQTNRFIELARRLPSRIHLRQLDEQDLAVVEECVIADEHGLLARERFDALDARYDPRAPLRARLKLRYFNELWDRSLPAREFSELRI